MTDEQQNQEKLLDLAQKDYYEHLKNSERLDLKLGILIGVAGGLLAAVSSIPKLSWEQLDFPVVLLLAFVLFTVATFTCCGIGFSTLVGKKVKTVNIEEDFGRESPEAFNRQLLTTIERATYFVNSANDRRGSWLNRGIVCWCIAVVLASVIAILPINSHKEKTDATGRTNVERTDTGQTTKTTSGGR